MRIPTYIKEENYNIVKIDDTYTSIRICNKLENEQNNELYEIYFYGSLLEENMICGVYDEENDSSNPCLIVAKCIHTGKEILLYDEAKYGYNPIFCDEINLDVIKNRSLSKLEIPNSKFEKITLESKMFDMHFETVFKIRGERLGIE